MTKKDVKKIAKQTAKKTAKKTATKIANGAKLETVQEKTKKNRRAKQITKRTITKKIDGQDMPITLYATTYKGESFEHTDKAAVKAWRKERKAADRKPVDPAVVIARLDRAIKRAVKVLGADLVVDTVNNALDS